MFDIVQFSIATGVFPDSWKIASVGPVFKCGQSNDCSNYRSISLRPFLSRVFEKLIYNQLYDCFDRNRLLFSSVGLDRCTPLSPVCLTVLTTGILTWIVSVDLKKAFVTVDHEILFQKLKEYGIIGLESTWFVSYLDNRMQFCSYWGFLKA